MNKIILALTFLIVALVGAGAVAATGDAGNTTVDDLNEIAVDSSVVDTVNATEAVAVENVSDNVACPDAGACVNDSGSDLDNVGETVDVVACERPGSADVQLENMVQMTPLKSVSFKAVAKQQSVSKIYGASSSMKVSKNTLSSIKSLYGSHFIEAIAMAVGLTPAQTKNIIKDMKAGKHGNAYKKAMLKIDKSIKNTKNAKYIIK